MSAADMFGNGQAPEAPRVMPNLLGNNTGSASAPLMRLNTGSPSAPLMRLNIGAHGLPSTPLQAQTSQSAIFECLGQRE